MAYKPRLRSSRSFWPTVTYRLDDDFRFSHVCHQTELNQTLHMFENWKGASKIWGFSLKRWAPKTAYFWALVSPYYRQMENE